MDAKIKKRDPSSFRDPVAMVYQVDGRIFREIYPGYFSEYDYFKEKVYPDLVDLGLIIPHREIVRDDKRILITPERIPLITYPYEWSFAKLKEAALVTLQVNKIAMERGMILKDASAYNVQYAGGRMRFIDTTSFEFYSGDIPWTSYPQFLRHFVCPLLLIKYRNTDFRRLSEIYLDGIPIPLTKHLLPGHAKVRRGVLLHIVTQSWADLFREPKANGKPVKMSRTALTAVINDLYNFILKLNYRPYLDRGWIKYAEAGSYSPASLENKKHIIKDLLFNRPGVIANNLTLVDLGANTGDYSRMAALYGYNVIAVDADHDCMFHLDGNRGILPMIVDLCNPSPGIGWANQERSAFWDRIGKVDTILALALIHHLSIRNNVPLAMVADLFADHCNRLIVEWIPPDDKQAIRLVGNKTMIPPYDQGIFLDTFTRHFPNYRSYPITGSGRIIFDMEKKE